MCKVMCLGCSHVGMLCHSGQMQSLVRSREMRNPCPIVGLIWQWFMCVNMYVWMCELVPSFLSRSLPFSLVQMLSPLYRPSITVSPVSLSLPFSSIISVTVALRCSPPIVAGVKISPHGPSTLPLSSHKLWPLSHSLSETPLLPPARNGFADPYSVYWDSGGYIGLRTKGGWGKY